MALPKQFVSIGDVYGGFVVVDHHPNVNQKRCVKAKCLRCFSLSVIEIQRLIMKKPSGCHCVNTKHGMSNGRGIVLRTYSIWSAMISRCHGFKSKSSHVSYRLRGITVCEEWRDFSRFFADMGDPPTDKHSIDRIDNSKGYSKDNCRWATPTEQARNRSGNVKFRLADGRIVCLSELSEMCGINRTAVGRGIKRGGFQYVFNRHGIHVLERVSDV